MKKYWQILVALCLVAPVYSLAQNFNTRSVVPKSLSQYQFGMGLDDFTKKNKSATTPAADDSKMSFRIEYTDKNAGSGIKQVIYYFDAENDKPLYEMIIQFNDVHALDAHCSKKMGSANDGKQWKWKTKEGYTFKAWRFSNNLVLALALPSTEWEKDWDN